MKKFFVKILGNEKTQNIAIPLFSILLSLIVGMIVIGSLGKYPLTAYAKSAPGKRTSSETPVLCLSGYAYRLYQLP